MTDEHQLIEPADSGSDRRNERREFFRAALGAVGVTAAGAAALSAATSASAAVIADNDTVVFLTQLGYLVGQYYSYATTGSGLPAAQLTGTGTAGAAAGARQVGFTDPVVAQYAADITADLVANVNFLRTQLGSDGVVAQPAIDLSTTATGAFSLLAAAAGIVAKGASFDPYASDTNFLLGAFMLEDVIVTGYVGEMSVITDKTLMGSLAGILATHAHHAAMIRALLYSRGTTVRGQADSISNVRDNLDGTTTDLDQGISPATVGANMVSNITPAAANGAITARANGQVLNEFYLNSAAVTKGGFFPAGLNGAVNTAQAN